MVYHILVKPASYEYHRAHDLEHALELLGELGEDAKPLAGGQSLVPMMNFRLARPSALIDLARLDELRYLRPVGDGLRIGALTTHRTVETATLPGGFGVLSRAARWIGHYPIRSRGTIGGSLAHGDATAEWCVLAVLLDARIVLRGPRGQRTVPAAEFFHGFLSTAAEPGELITEVVFPSPAPRAALTEFAQRQGDFGLVVVAVALETEGGHCRAARVAAGGVGSAAQRLPAVEQALAGAELTERAFAEAARAGVAELEPPEDIHASAGYRRTLTATLLRRACLEAGA